MRTTFDRIADVAFVAVAASLGAVIAIAVLALWWLAYLAGSMFGRFVELIRTQRR